MDPKVQTFGNNTAVQRGGLGSRAAPFAFWGVILAIATIASLTVGNWANLLPSNQSLHFNFDKSEVAVRPKVVRSYNITVGFRWLNLDGGRWRPMFVCNGESPCPTLNAREGDQVNIHVTNDLGAQLSIHWSGMSHRRLGFWNDGTGGLNQYPILPRGNWTSQFDTTGHWGLNWYADHTGAGVADGVYGMIWTAPDPTRPRPYSLITGSAVERQLMQEAEDEIQHLGLWNSDFRTADWKIQKMKAKGTGLSCYKSVLVNGKGRVLCKNPNYSTIDGQELDEAGCVVREGIESDACSPTKADFQIVETHGKPYIMLNLVNVGFEHALKFSIDDHQFWIVANDAGFTEPQLIDTVYITNGARVTILIKLDQVPADYAIRLASASKLQNLEGFAVLRYPAKRYPMFGVPMELPATGEKTKICLNPDSTIPDGCREVDHDTIRPYPNVVPEKQSDKALRFMAGSQHSKYEKHVEEYFVNQKPWQLFRAAMEPVYFTKNATALAKPVETDLPMGAVIDLIVQNTINETIPMYKHGDPTFRLGSQAFQTFDWKSVADAVRHNAAVNVENPPLGVVHDLPPLGWLAIRWKVSLSGATMFHAVKLRYFALGMAAPLLEGFHDSVRDSIPAYAKNQPHVNFEPGNDGVFG